MIQPHNFCLSTVFAISTALEVTGLPGYDTACQVRIKQFVLSKCLHISVESNIVRVAGIDHYMYDTKNKQKYVSLIASK